MKKLLYFITLCFLTTILFAQVNGTPTINCVVFDTIIEDMPADYIWNRPWGKGNNPKTAVWEFLKNNDSFVVNKNIYTFILLVFFLMSNLFI